MSLTRTSILDSGENIKYRIGNSNLRHAKTTNVSNIMPPSFPHVSVEQQDISLLNLVNMGVLSPAMHFPNEILIYS